MGSENNTWINIRKGLITIKPRPHFQRFEDKLTGGIPDVMYCYLGLNGWIELKQADEFPKRANTPVRLKFRNDQYNWIHLHQKAGGRACLLAQIGREYFMFCRLEFLRRVCHEEFTQTDFRKYARIYSSGKEAVYAILGVR